MADNLEPDISFDLGIMDSRTMGSVQEAEAFLSDTAIKAKDSKELEEIEEEEEVSTKKPIAKKEQKVPPKKSAVELGENLLSEEEGEEETEEEEEAPVNTKIKKKEGEEEEEGNQFETFSKELYSLNVLSHDAEEGEAPIAKTGEELLDLLNNEKRKGAIAWIDNFLEQHGEGRRELFDAIFVKGADPKEYLPLYNQAVSLENLDLEKEINQEKVVREFYRRAGIAEDKIGTKIQRLKDTADLQSEAEDFHPQLLEQDKNKAKAVADAAEQTLKAKEQIEGAYRNSILKTVSEKAKGKDFEGIPISPQLVREAVDFLQTDKWRTADGQLLTDFDKLILETKKPEGVHKRLMIAFLEKINWDFSKIEKKAASKQSGELFNSLAQKDLKNKTQKKQTPELTQW